MNSNGILRLAMLVAAYLAFPAKGAILWWPVPELNDYSNPLGPDYKPYFLTNGGSRMVFERPDGPMVIPMDELYGRAMQAQLLYHPATWNPRPVSTGDDPPRVPPISGLVVAPADSGTGTGTGGGGGTSGGRTQVPLAEAAVQAIPEPETMALMGAGLIGLALVTRRRGRR